MRVKKFVYIGIPKTGCSSLYWTIEEAFGINRAKARRQFAISRAAVLRTKALCFTIVRNPFARIVSAWADKERRYHNVSFAKAVEFAISRRDGPDRHYLPQSMFLFHDGRPLVHHFIRHENLAKAFEPLRKHYGLARLPHHNRSEHRPYQEHYTPPIRRMVEDHFARDLELLGYTFDGKISDAKLPTRVWKGPKPF